MPGISPEAAIGAVELTVRDLARSLDFYEHTLGFRRLDAADSHASLGAGKAPLLRLHGDPKAPARPRRTAGLFHFAILVPSRPDLARSLALLAERRWPLTGASDHLVSEALYVNDPDGIGIEIYRDRPREEWELDGDQVRMATLPLDLDSIIGDLDEPALGDPELAPATRIGHVHLNVADLADSEAFYCGELGFHVTTRSYSGALFVAADEYHHHVGLNVWNGEGAPPPPDGAIGLRHYEIVVPDGAGRALTDPSGNRLLIRT